MGLCESCKNTSCGYASEDVIRCGDFEENTTQTNADRIRAMSDEELAKLFCGFCKNSKICEGCPMCDVKCAESELAESWVEWLKQPAEVTDDDPMEV